jgi:RNA-directed DNA polymerase
MNEREKSDSLAAPSKSPSQRLRSFVRRWWRKGGWLRGRRTAQRVPDTVPDPTCQVGWIVCVKQYEGTRMHGSSHYCILSTRVVSKRPTGQFAVRPHRGWTGVTWHDYGKDLEENLQDLNARVHSGAYWASPARRVYIEKADGRLPPLGIATLEEKILQRHVVEVLNAIYEEDFLGFPTGSGPGAARITRWMRSRSEFTAGR